MKNRIYLVFTVVIIMISCEGNRLPKNPIKHFKITENVVCKNTVDISEYDILAPATILKYNDWYVFREKRDDNACIKMIKTDFTKSIKGVKQGNGPLDVVGRFVLDKTDDSLYIIDSNHKRIFSLDIVNDTIKLNVVKENVNLNSSVIMLNTDRFIEPTRKDSMMYRLIDADRNVMSKIYYPKNVFLSEFNYMAQNSIYMNTLFACSPDKMHYAWGVTNYMLFGFGNISNNNLSLNVVYEYSPMKVGRLVNNKDDRLRILPARENQISTISCVGTEKYVLFLYYGEKYQGEPPTSSDLLVYEWSGKPYKHIKLDKQMLLIQYDVERNILFGIAYSPDATLVEYDMNTILK